MNSLRLAQTKMLIRFNAKHKLSDLKKKVFLKFIKSEKSEYQVFNHFSLSSKKIDLFQIVKKLSSLTYELDLSSSMKVHFVISVIHLEQANEDQYNRDISKISKALKENEKKIFVVEKIIKQRKTDEIDEYLVKWKEYENST